ncbi:hypothetical protein AN958_00553 [Leucoagaricus sp. SymC.cos]|nr:hypothetical protein AN958_00553 [Leucoagaricus sp. SymC.cos]
MVHRPSDARLLSNLISHEKDYSKQLQSLLDSSHASLASFSTFAAATVLPISQAILAIAGDFSRADDALRRYKDAVDAWREQLKTLKDMETDVSTIMRDREILVTRLLKASKNEKPPKDKGNNASKRTSILSNRAPSTSSLSLSLENSYAPSSSLPISNKLAAARAELQACEAHLANKERELEGARITAIRDGLRIRCNALTECGRTWVEMGGQALQTAENLQVKEGGSIGHKQSRESYSVPQYPFSSPHKALPPHMQAETGSDRGYRLSSDISSIGPSQSASQVNVLVVHSTAANPSTIPNAPNPILGANGSDIQQRGEPSTATHVENPTVPTARPNSTPPLMPPPIRSGSPFAMPIHRSNSLTHVAPVTTYHYSEIQVPPAHAIQEGTIPKVASVPTKLEPKRSGSGYLTPVSNEEGSRSTLETPTGYRTTHADGQDFDVEGDDACPNLSKEQRLIKEGKLQVVENSRYHQAPAVSGPPVAAPAPVHVEEQPVEMPVPPPAPVTIVDSVPHEGINVPGVREIRQETELPERPNEPPPGVSPSVPIGEPQTPKKRANRVGSPSPQKSGFLGSLKKVFGGHLVDDDDSMRRYRSSARPTSVLGGRKTIGDKRTSRTDRNISDVRRESADVDAPDEMVDGYVMRKNVELQKNLRGGIMEVGHGAPLDLRHARVRIPSDTGTYASDGRRRAGKSARTSTGGNFVVERGAKVTRSSSVPPTTSYVSPPQAPGVRSSTLYTATAPSGMPQPAPLIVPSAPGGTDTHFREELSSQNGGSIRQQPMTPANGVAKDRGYASDTTGFAATSRISGMPAAPATLSPTTGALSIPSVRRKASKKRSSTSRVEPVEGADMGRQASVLTNATAPAGMSTGLGGRRGSVGVSVATPRASMAGGGAGTRSHRRAVSVDYGRTGPVATAPIVHAPPPRALEGQESLMSIVNNVTRSNRQAWDAGLTESRIDRTRGAMRSEVGSTFLGRVTSGNGSEGPVTMTGVDGVPLEESRGVGSVQAPSRVDRQSLLSSLKGTPGSPGRAQSSTVYTNPRTHVDGTHEKRPLKSALRMSRSPSPDGAPLVDGVAASRGYGHGFATDTGKDRIVPMEMVPSASDSSVLPPPVERVRGVTSNVAEPRRRKSSTGVLASTSVPKSVPRPEEDVDRRPGLGSPPLAMPSPVRMLPISSHIDTGFASEASSSQRRKSVRVSLNPTFSPTPPAIEDEEDEAGRAPFVFKDVSAPAPVTTANQYHAPPPVMQVPKAYGTSKSAGKDAWDDDSDEDAEYQRAKSMLLKVTRRGKEAMRKSTRT